MALQPLDRAKAKHGMNTSRRQQPSLVVRSNKWVAPLIASTHGPGGERAQDNRNWSLLEERSRWR